MSEAQTVNWRGASRKDYPFTVHELNSEFAPDHAGVYILAKPTDQPLEALFIGQTDSLSPFPSRNSAGPQM